MSDSVSTHEEVVRVERLLEMPLSGSTAPALVEDALGRRFVLKLRGSAVGAAALAAEFVASQVGRLLGLRVPAPRLMWLTEVAARQERHAELADLLRSSVGLNLGLEYLDGAVELPRYVVRRLPAELASTIVWFDALLKNVDRTARNPNVLFLGEELWLIDHGACRVFEDSPTGSAAIREHLFLHQADDLAGVALRAEAALSAASIAGVFARVPDEWWDGPPPVDVLRERIATSSSWIEELEDFRREPPAAIGPLPDRRPEWARKRHER